MESCDHILARPITLGWFCEYAPRDYTYPKFVYGTGNGEFSEGSRQVPRHISVGLTIDEFLNQSIIELDIGTLWTNVSSPQSIVQQVFNLFDIKIKSDNKFVNESSIKVQLGIPSRRVERLNPSKSGIIMSYSLGRICPYNKEIIKKRV